MSEPTSPDAPTAALQCASCVLQGNSPSVPIWKRRCRDCFDRAIAAAEAAAYRRGQESMRERAAVEAGDYHNTDDSSDAIRALPLEDEQ